MELHVWSAISAFSAAFLCELCDLRLRRTLGEPKISNRGEPPRRGRRETRLGQFLQISGCGPPSLVCNLGVLCDLSLRTLRFKTLTNSRRSQNLKSRRAQRNPAEVAEKHD